jgi:predicted transcriptional regulator
MRVSYFGHGQRDHVRREIACLVARGRSRGVLQPDYRHSVDSEVAERLAAVLKALAEPTRLRLVSLIAGHEDGEACVCDLTAPVGLSQPTVSHHLKILVEAGLLERTQPTH